MRGLVRLEPLGYAALSGLPIPAIGGRLVGEYVPSTCHGNAKEHAANQGGVEPSCPRLSHVSPLYSQVATVWTGTSRTATGLAPVRGPVLGTRLRQLKQ